MHPLTASSARLRRDLRACTLDGSAYATMVGCGETYFAAFALMLNASPTQVGILATLPVLVGSAFQLLAPYGAALVGNKRWVIGSALLQASTFVPIAWLAAERNAPFWSLLAWVSLYWILALGINSPWNVWIGRMIPTEVRSRYFARRNVVIQATLLIALTGGGLLLHVSERHGSGATGFVVLFGIAAAARMVSAWFLSRQSEPPAEPQPHSVEVRGVFHDLLGRPYGRIIRLVVLIYGAVHLSAAYFTPYMLKELKLSYAQFTILNGTVLVARVLASAYWGEIAYTFGNRRALQVASVLLVPLSALWVISDNFAYLIGLQLYAGFAWAGFELLTILSFFDCTDERNRARVLSLYGLLNGVAMVISSMIGGLVLRLAGSSGYAYIFLGSSLLRAATVIFFSGKVGRKLPGEHSFQNVFVRVLTFRPTEGPQLRPLLLEQKPKRGRH